MRKRKDSLCPYCQTSDIVNCAIAFIVKENYIFKRSLCRYFANPVTLVPYACFGSFDKQQNIDQLLLSQTE